MDLQSNVGIIIWNQYPTIVNFVCGLRQFCLANILHDRHCGLVVRIPGYRSRGPGSIPAATKFSE
jgi:hypothetical protein